MLTFPSTSQKQAGDVWIDYLHHTVWCGRLSTSVRRGPSRLSTEEEVFNLLIKTRGRHKVTASNFCQYEFREQETGRVVSGNLHGYRSERSRSSRVSPFLPRLSPFLPRLSASQLGVSPSSLLRPDTTYTSFICRLQHPHSCCRVTGFLT